MSQVHSLVHHRIVEEGWLEPKHIVGLLYRIVEKGWLEPKHTVGLLQNSREGLVYYTKT